MSSFIAWFIASMLIAMIIRFTGVGIPVIIAVSTGGGMVAGQLWVKWMTHGATSFPEVTAILVLFALGAGMGVASASVAHLLHRLFMGRREGPSAEAEVASRRGRAGKGAARYAGPRKPSPPTQIVGIVAISSAMVALAGPYLSVSNRGWAPLATIDPTATAMLLCIFLAWFVSFTRNWHLAALSLGTLGCCLTWIPLISGPQQMLGESTRLVGGWVLGLSSMPLVICPVFGHLTWMKEQQPDRTPNWFGLGVAVSMPVMLLVGVYFALLTWSESARAAMHPSPQTAFSDWASLHWRDPWDREERTRRLEHVLSARVSGSPEWWSQVFPILLKDPDPQFRFAAMSMNNRAKPPIPLSEVMLETLLRDPEPRLCEAGLRTAFTMKAAPPDKELLKTAMRACFENASDKSVILSSEELETWIGREQMVEIFAEVLMRSGGVAHTRVRSELNFRNRTSADKPMLIPEVLGIVVKEVDSVRRSRGLQLVEDAVHNHQWVPPKPICDYVKEMRSQPGEIGADAVRIFDSIQRRNCCREP